MSLYDKRGLLMSNRNPIENLGDYNKVREDLQAAGGNLFALYKSIGDTAVIKAAPKLLLEGIAIGVVGLASFNKCVGLMKTRKQKIEKEPELKKKFAKALEVTPENTEDGEVINETTKRV